MAWGWLIGDEDPGESPPIADRLSQLRLLLDSYALTDRNDFSNSILAEQKETLDLHLDRENAEAVRWVRSEIAFVETHATEIDAAIRAA
jgi:hypothetical protein